MTVEKTLLDYTNSFSSNDYQEHDKKTNSYFRDKYGKRVKRKP